MSARVTVAMRYPVPPFPTSAQAATPPPSTTTSTTAPIRTARRWPARPQPERELDLGTGTPATTEAATAGTAEAATTTAAASAETTEPAAAGPAGGGDPDGGRRDRPVGRRRAEGADAVADGEVSRRRALGGAHRGRTRRRDLQRLRLRLGHGGLLGLRRGLVGTAGEGSRVDTDARHRDCGAADTRDLARSDGQVGQG